MEKNTDLIFDPDVPQSAVQQPMDEHTDTESGIPREDEVYSATYGNYSSLEANEEEPNGGEPIIQNNPYGSLQQATSALFNNSEQELQLQPHGTAPLPRGRRRAQPDQAVRMISPFIRSSTSRLSQEEPAPRSYRSIWERDAEACDRFFREGASIRPAPFQLPPNMLATTPNVPSRVAGQIPYLYRLNNSHGHSSSGLPITRMPAPDEPTMTSPSFSPFSVGSSRDLYHEPWYQAAPQGRDDQYSQQSLTRQEGTNSTRGVYQTGYASASVNPQGASVPAPAPAVSTSGPPPLSPASPQEPKSDDEASRIRDRFWKVWTSPTRQRGANRTFAPATFAPRPPLRLLARFLLHRNLIRLPLPRRNEDVEAYVDREEHFTRASFEEFAARDTESYYEDWKKWKRSDKRHGAHIKKRARDEEDKQKQAGGMTQSTKRKRDFSEGVEDEEMEEFEDDVEVENAPTLGKKKRARAGKRKRRFFEEDDEHEL